MDVAKYGIQLTMEGEAAIVRSFDNIASKGEQAASRIQAGFTKTSQGLANTARTSAAEYSKQLEAQFQRDSARIKEGLARGFLTPQDARKAGADAAREYNAGVLSQLDRMGAAGLNAGNSKVYNDLAGSLMQVEKSAKLAGPTINTVRAAVQSFTASTLSAAPGVAQLGGALGQMALGASTTIALLAGVAAITYAYNTLTESAKKAADEQERVAKIGKDYINSIGRPAGDMGTASTQQSEIANRLLDERNRLQKEYDDLLARQTAGEAGLGLAIGSRYDKLVDLNREYLTASAESDVLRKKTQDLTDEQKKQVNEKVWEEIAYQLDLAADRMNAYDAVSTRITAKLRTSTEQWTQASAGYRAAAEAADYLARSLTSIQASASSVGARNQNAAIVGLDASAATAQRAILKNAQDTARAIQESVSAATDLAQAFHLVDANIASMLKSLTQIGSSIGPLIEQLKAFKTPDGKGGNLGSALGLLGAISPIVGGIASLAGSLFGGAEAARAQRAAQQALKDSIEQTTESLKHQAGLLSDLQYQLGQLDQQEKSQATAIAQSIYNDFKNKYGATLGSHLDEMNKAIAAALAANTSLFETLKKSAQDADAAAKAAAEAERRLNNSRSGSNSMLRILNATGQDDAAFALQQLIEMQDAIASGLDAIALGLLTQAEQAEAAQREREKQTQILQDQLSAAQQQVQQLQAVYDSLDQFSKSLNVGQYSPLSPRQQLDASRGQLNSLYQAALGGDQQAAGQFSSTAQQFLDASRKYNASSAGYVLDFNSVSVMAEALKSKFAAQLTDAQMQVSLLQQQLDVLKSIDTSLGSWIPVNIPPLDSRSSSWFPVNIPPLDSQSSVAAPVGGGGSGQSQGISADGAVFAAGTQGIIEMLGTLADSVAELQTTVRRGNESIVAAVA